MESRAISIFAVQLSKKIVNLLKLQEISGNQSSGDSDGNGKGMGKGMSKKRDEDDFADSMDQKR